MDPNSGRKPKCHKFQYWWHSNCFLESTESTNWRRSFSSKRASSPDELSLQIGILKMNLVTRFSLRTAKHRLVNGERIACPDSRLTDPKVLHQNQKKISEKIGPGEISPIFRFWNILKDWFQYDSFNEFHYNKIESFRVWRFSSGTFCLWEYSIRVVLSETFDWLNTIDSILLSSLHAEGSNGKPLRCKRHLRAGGSIWLKLFDKSLSRKLYTASAEHLLEDVCLI